ncbi:MAG: glutathione S-transferase family protein [Hydrogenophaga sp.]|uniref:glutathione S-transferase family protein n=1 Tax=Hydrogenophaga sp. TaxID=1904254 RepID=UPI0027258CFA|nr:glutathione S-transferase family protein [Hydrogenophaga sp.]MDO9505376.1 glutathione S-transferase family protein [Hydrogenophaga sp.]MDP2220619.1 glutathione S-transferase family protein [Hydrogenophaga sp.]
MMTLYGDLRSRAHRVAWMLKELGTPFEHVPTHFLDGSTRTPEYLGINPNGRVPALKDGDLVLFESLAINLYLARKHGGPLAPVDLREEALATQWTIWVLTEIEKPLLLTAANLFLFAEEERNAQEAAAMTRKLGRPFKVLDAHLRERPYLLGDRFTVADLNVSSVMTLAPLSSMDLGEWPALNAWLTRCLERPAAADWKPIKFRIPRPPTPLAMLESFV